MFLTLAAHWCEFALVHALFFCLNATARAVFYLGVRAWRALVPRRAPSGARVGAAAVDCLGVRVECAPSAAAAAMSHDDYAEL